MTENEIKAIKWIKNVRDDAVVTLDHIEKNEPNVSPMLYAGRREKAETIIKGFEELETYRAIGTVEEFKALKEKSTKKKPIKIVKTMNVFKEWGKYECPCCKNYLGNLNEYSYPNYCYKCGTEIDWE